METVSESKAFGGTQGVYRHRAATTGTDMTFSVYVPAHEEGERLPVLWYLSGLTCTHANVTDKGEYRRACAEHGIIFIAPDTSPRGGGVPDDDSWDFGQSAGFYLDATEAPWSESYRMETHVTKELPSWAEESFPIASDRRGIFGHSMGGHGALTLALRHPERYASVSAFAPIVAPSRVPWGEKAFSRYLGADRARWAEHDACELVAKRTLPFELLVDQGTSDKFLERELKPELFEEACRAAGQKLRLRQHEGYDHSYYFIATMMEDHLRHHARTLLG